MTMKFGGIEIDSSKNGDRQIQKVMNGIKVIWENWIAFASAGGALPTTPWTCNNTSYTSFTDGYILTKSTNSSGGKTTGYWEIQNAFESYDGILIEATAKATSGMNNSIHFRKNGGVYLDIGFNTQTKAITLGDGANGNKNLTTVNTDLSVDHKVKLEIAGTTVSFWVDDVCYVDKVEVKTWTGTGSKVLFGCANAWDNCNFYVKELTVKVRGNSKNTNTETTITDDGLGNVVITSNNVAASDDGTGNVTVTGNIKSSDDSNGNVRIEVE